MTGSVAEPQELNEVTLRGRVTVSPEVKVLPSGSEIVICRISVARERTVMTAGSKQRVDVIDCVAWSTKVRRSVAGWRPGDVVELTGALRRRFFRSGAATGSRVEIEVLSAKVLSRAKSAG